MKDEEERDTTQRGKLLITGLAGLSAAVLIGGMAMAGWRGATLFGPAAMGGPMGQGPGPGHMTDHPSMMGPGMMGPGGSAVSQAPASDAIPGAREVRVQGRDFGFTPASITLKAGEPVNLVFENEGQMLHDFTVPALGVHVQADPGQSATTGFRVSEPETYEYFCSVPGHAEAGMRGTLTVSA